MKREEFQDAIKPLVGLRLIRTPDSFGMHYQKLVGFDVRDLEKAIDRATDREDLATFPTPAKLRAWCETERAKRISIFDVQERTTGDIDMLERQAANLRAFKRMYNDGSITDQDIAAADGLLAEKRSEMT